MDPNKRKIEESLARWQETDPNMRRLKERIERGRAEIEKERRAREEGSAEGGA